MEKFNLEFNKFLTERGGGMSRTLSLLDLVELKKILSGLNNTLTQELESLAQKWLEETVKAKTNPPKNANANGFDITGDDLVAEVKFMVPVKGKRFGANQTTGIAHDLEKLLSSTKKNRFLFLGFTGESLGNTSKAIEHLLESKFVNKEVKLWKDREDSQEHRTKVQVVLLQIK